MSCETAPVTKANTDCLVCPVRNCLGRQCGSESSSSWGDMLAPRQSVMPGAAMLMRTGDRLRHLYSVRGGCLKSFTLDTDGNERIRGFYLPGDLVGLDSLAEGVSLANIGAIVPSQVCVAPLGNLKQAMLLRPELAQRAMEQVSRELALALAIGGDYSAEERVSAFLLMMQQRLGTPQTLQLPMAQRDIGNYLRLANETVCRTLKIFERRGWLQIEASRIRMIDAKSMWRIAEAVGVGTSSRKLDAAA